MKALTQKDLKRVKTNVETIKRTITDSLQYGNTAINDRFVDILNALHDIDNIVDTKAESIKFSNRIKRENIRLKRKAGQGRIENMEAYNKLSDDSKAVFKQSIDRSPKFSVPKENVMEVVNSIDYSTLDARSKKIIDEIKKEHNL